MSEVHDVTTPTTVLAHLQPTSYYGQPVLKRPTWKSRDIGGYLFLGGLAGAASTLAGAAALSGRGHLARTSKLGAAGAGALSVVALVHDLGRPSRFYNMLRVFKPTSPMSVGSWLLGAYVPAAGAAAMSDVTGILPAIGAAATSTAALLGPAVASYTGALVADTAVPAWHDGYRDMPPLFAASGAASAAGWAMLTGAAHELAPVRRLAVTAGAGEVALARHMTRSLHPVVRRAYETGTAGALMKAGEVLAAAGAIGSVLGRRSRLATRLSGVMLLAGSACTRFGIFHAGVQSAGDPQATIAPQRDRVQRGDRAVTRG